MNKEISKNEIVPGYFHSIYNELLKKGVPESQLKRLIPMLTTLHQMKCIRPTIEALCIRGGLVSLEALTKANYSLRTYQELGVEYQQRLLLVNVVKKLNLKTAPTKSTLAITAFIQKISEMANQAAQRNKESLSN